jgi:hypothetical protein
MKEKVICMIQTQSHPIILSLVFVGADEHWDLENLSSHLAHSRCGHQNFLKNGKQVQIFADAK